MEFPIHDPHSTVYRNPAGAVPSGTVIRLTISTPADYEVEKAVLCGNFLSHKREFEITMDKSRKDGRDLYSANVETGGETGQLRYYFRLNRIDGLPYWYGPMESDAEHPDITGGIYNIIPAGWRVTLYNDDASAAAWFSGGVTYQIFPDRLFSSHTPKTPARTPREYHENWDDAPKYYREGEKADYNDFFGGDIEGIRQKLDYLESLGVTNIYLNPIFEAHSNHRYDTADYTRVDPDLGDEHDLRRLCSSAGERGMHIVLDGVFNHTGADSVYFDAFSRFGGNGAAARPDSPYRDWYTFRSWPDSYESWWGVRDLPAINKLNDRYVGFIARDENSVIRRWTRCGISGWRLDVADELPDGFIREIKKALREEKPDALLLGEVWEDASDKISYGARRKYLEGGELDSVMNYPLRDAVIKYLSGADAFGFYKSMLIIADNYPPVILNNLLNILGTHDTPRILTVLGQDAVPPSRDERALAVMDESSRTKAKRLLKLATVIQYTFPGTPCIYYGDEVGMEGYEDPFNRRTYPWGREDRDILKWYMELGHMRRRCTPLDGGKLEFLLARGDVLIYRRAKDDKSVITAVNKGNEEHDCNLIPSGARDLITGDTYCGKLAPVSAAVYLL